MSVSIYSGPESENARASASADNSAQSLRERRPLATLLPLTLPCNSESLDQRRATGEGFNMAVAVERLAQEALALSDQERAELARKLLVSLEGPPDEGVDAAWDTEIKDRVDRIREGTAKGRPAEEVFRDIRARYE